jgi:hypothetical protein
MTLFATREYDPDLTDFDRVPCDLVVVTDRRRRHVQNRLGAVPFHRYAQLDTRP